MWQGLLVAFLMFILPFFYAIKMNLVHEHPANNCIFLEARYGQQGAMLECSVQPLGQFLEIEGAWPPLLSLPAFPRLDCR